jgi:peptidyl-prolyl cis-trans isomerase B (cyclophilin B)
VTSSRDRQRAAARARLEREMALRAEAASRRRRTQAVVGAAVAVLVVIGGIVWLVLGTGGDKKKSAAPAASASPGASQTASATKCAWLPLVDPSASPAPAPLPKEIKNVGTPPVSGEPRSGIETLTITTNLGVIKIAVDTAKAPCTAASFTYLASKKFYDNTKCHRMTTAGIFVLQCGDPSATGRGGPAYRMAEENLPVGKRPAYPEGIVAMAKGQSPASSSSQFFIVYKDTDSLQPDYTVLGRVTEGLDIVKKVAEAGVTPSDPQNPNDGTPKTEVKIVSLTMSPPAPASS